MNKVMVKAVKSFYWGVFANLLKTPRSEPFEVTEHECKQLLDNKLVVIVTDESPELADNISQSEQAPETVPEPEPISEPEPVPVPEPEQKKPRAKRTTKAAE
ncbi:hypothetical protein ERJ77_01565 [Vibrio anguillarum]|uniref:Uncharacterized protein n=1 Tax=Vibrio anguillarum TaxID=55601 RepID=A0AAW4BA07_VIBAN|nr:hypothetical protein [Vibrio anguillarum]